MRALILALPLAALAGCEARSTIDRTGETVTYAGKSYDVYEEKGTVTMDVDGKVYPTYHKMIWLGSRYVWCDGSCQSTVEAWLGP